MLFLGARIKFVILPVVIFFAEFAWDENKKVFANDPPWTNTVILHNTYWPLVSDLFPNHSPLLFGRLIYLS